MAARSILEVYLQKYLSKCKIGKGQNQSTSAKEFASFTPEKSVMGSQLIDMEIIKYAQK